ncbi:MAG: YraN family protein [bacterium]
MEKRYNQRVGEMGEQKAAQFLEKQGYKILERNYRYQRGEIDIIAKNGGEIVFVEVKTKLRGDFGEPEDRVGLAKQRQIGRVAMGYLQSKKIYGVDCRFDVISVTGPKKELHHIKDAFWLEDTD